MKLPFSGRVAVLLASVAFAGPAEKPAIGESPDAIPSKPAPPWLKVIDQGDLDPRLKGYKTPEGVKVEIVAEEPTVVNPVCMAFADDGAPTSSNGGPGISAISFRTRR